jgi:hypothetical protein
MAISSAQAFLAAARLSLAFWPGATLASIFTSNYGRPA